MVGTDVQKEATAPALEEVPDEPFLLALRAVGRPVVGSKVLELARALRRIRPLPEAEESRPAQQANEQDLPQVEPGEEEARQGFSHGVLRSVPVDSLLR